MTRSSRCAAATSLVVALAATDASAQVFGTFKWQMQPYCNTVTLTLTSVAGRLTVDGVDDLCGAARQAPAIGLAVFNPDGTVSVSFTVIRPGADAIHVSAVVSPANGQGHWRDDLGQSGTFALGGTTPGLPTRPDAPVYFRATETNGFSGSNVKFAIVRANTGGGTYSASTGVYTVPVGGYYAVHYSVGWTPGATTGGRVCAYILVPAPIAQGLHGGSCAPLVGTGGTTNVFTALTGSTIVPLNAGDTIVVQSEMNGTATLGSSAINGLVVMKLR